MNKAEASVGSFKSHLVLLHTSRFFKPAQTLEPVFREGSALCADGCFCMHRKAHSMLFDFLSDS